ncbi:MAG: Panacea domain-containing protein [Candidatus Acidiferrales bacterium]
MATIPVDRIAEGLINLSHDKQSPISNLKLQKLVYYSQAWHLALYGIPLFDEEIEAWVHGPVVPRVFHRYRDYRWGVLPRNSNIVSSEVRRHIEEVWSAYGSLSAYDLERMTHSEDPWKQARAGLAPDESSHNIISKGAMKEYYAARLDAPKQ